MSGRRKKSLDRRELLRHALAMSVAAPVVVAAADGQKPQVKSPGKSRGKSRIPAALPGDGGYPKVPLAQPELKLALVQTRLNMLDPEQPALSKRANLNYMLDWIDGAQSGTRHDMLVFHELPLTGLSMTWTRQTILRGCIEIPGPETEEIGKKAKQYACYIVFGSYEVDRDWPNHYMSVTTIIGPDGRIVDKQWKARNIMASLGGIELMTTTIFNVLDRYVEMYGWDRVIPIARTPIGNIATSTVQLEPEIYRAFALKGAEIVLRTATGRFRMADVQGAALHNGYWSAMVNNAYLPFDPNGIKRYWPDGDWRKPIADSTQVLSTIVDAQGRIVSQANSPEEQVIAATVPIAAQRANMRQPVVHMELYQALHNSYRGKYPPNIYLREQPESVDAAAKLLNSTTRWR